MEHLKAKYAQLAAALKAVQDAKKALDGVVGDYRAALDPYIKEFLRDNPDLLQDLALAKQMHEQASSDAEVVIEDFEDMVSGWALGEPSQAAWQLDMWLPGVNVDPSTVVISCSQSELFMAALKYAPHLLRLDEDAANEFFKQHSYAIGRNVGDPRKLAPHMEGMFAFIGVLPDPSVEIDEKTIIANINRYPQTEEEVHEQQEAQEHADELLEELADEYEAQEPEPEYDDLDDGDSSHGHGDPYPLEDDADNLTPAKSYNDVAPPPDDKSDIPF